MAFDWDKAKPNPHYTPKFTYIYQDTTAGTFYVRFIPMETKRFPHGLGLSDHFTQREKAEEFQQEIEKYITIWLEMEQWSSRLS